MFNVKQTTKKILYTIRHSFLTTSNGWTVVVLVMIALFATGSFSVMERNYGLQKRLESKKRELKIKELELASEQYRKEYRESKEYQELSQRIYFSKGFAGEKLLILPKNTEKAQQIDNQYKQKKAASSTYSPSNAQQWLDFISGNRARRLQDSE